MGRHSKSQNTASCVNDGARFVEFESVLRIRPLLKKENDHPILLEPLDDGCTVVLHPMPPKINEVISPSAALVRETLSSEAVHKAHDMDFRVDHIWPIDADQGKVYFSQGLPMALTAMEPLKSDPHLSGIERKNHLVIAMGAAGSGKTYTCWGGWPIHAKRKADSDGLIARIIDSLFSQSKHHIVNKKTVFAVNLSMIQVDQSKHNSIDCQLHDLLQPVPRTFSIATVSSSVSSLSMSSSGKSPAFQKIKTTEQGPARKRTASANSPYSSLDEPVSVEQDLSSADYHVINGQVRSCQNVEEAREALRTAMKNSYRLSNKRNQSHVLVTMQPVLIDRRGQSVREGGTLAVLDMAAYDSIPTTQGRAARRKESLPTQDGAYAAVLLCLRAHLENERSWSNTNGDGDMLSASDRMATSHHRVSLRKVPYIQHKLTMLLQPLFATKNTDKVHVSLLVTAYPGPRDYNEKKALLAEVIPFRRTMPTKEASTGLKATHHHRKKERSIKREHNKIKNVTASDADDEGSVGPKIPPMQVPIEITRYEAAVVAPGISNMKSMTYSDSSLEDNCPDPLPPPIAPNYSGQSHSAFASATLSPEASAPLESPRRPLMHRDQRRNRVSDFPGVDLESPSSVNSMGSCVSNPPSPQAHSCRPVSNLSHREGNFDTKAEKAQLSATRTVFSPMQTLNKVVHASKEQGKKVIERMSHLSVDKEDDSLQRRIHELENEKQRLLDENSDLRSEKDRLQKENGNLRSKLDRPENKDSPPHKTASKHDDPQSQAAGLVDQSLLAHMASMGGYSGASAWSSYAR